MLPVSRYVLVLLLGASAHGAEPSAPPPAQPWFPKSPPLPAPGGPVTRVASTEQLFAAVEEAKPGDTVLVEPGHYWLARRLRLQVDRLALRGATGQRERVILDGQRSQDGELLALQACSDVTIADLTIQNVRHNGIKINSDSNVQRVTIHNCVLHNIWQRAVKGVKVPLAQRTTMGPGDCRIEYCLFYNDRPKEFSDDPADTPENFQGNYVGGIDVMFARNWLIHDNVFLGIQGRTRSGRGAIFLWHEAENCVVERNILVDCDVGIALGNSYKPTELSWHARRCLVRNNFVTRAPESGIVADYTSDCQIVHNTIHDPTNRLGRLIRLVHDNPGLLVANNLLSGPPLRNESSSTMALRRNPAQDCTAFFVNPAAGDLHLRKDLPESLGPSDPGASVEEEDIDRQNPRQPSRPGADQFPADDAGDVLHNGIMLPREWPPRLAQFPTSVETDPVVPPYLTSPPPVIAIDVGRQLFVDDFLIAETTLARTFHLATYHPDSPVVQPDQPWETKDANRAAAMVFSDGVWYDPKEGLFKMWYLVGEDAATGYATSSDGIHWNKPSLDVRPPTNIVQPGGRDSSTVWLDLEEKDPARRYKMFRVIGAGEDPVTGWNNWVMAIHLSADGVHWGEPVAKTGRLVDRSTVFWNPFRQVWVYSIRHVYRTGGAQDKSYGFARRRSYVEGRDVLAAARWEVNEPLRWIDVDRLDPVREDLQVKPQLYNLDAVAYESLLVGFFTVWRGQPADRHKPNHLVLGYSRDGWHWSRPDRRAFCPVSDRQGDWNANNVQSAGGGFLVVGEELYFYVSGRSGRPGGNQPGQQSTGLATLRRDGFASMDAGENAGTLTTRLLRFHGAHLFVNVNNAQGELRVEVLNGAGEILPRFSAENCIPIAANKALQPVRWRSGDDLSALANQPVRFRFHLKNGQLYAFWVAPGADGASQGYVAAGGPGFSSNRDTGPAPRRHSTR